MLHSTPRPYPPMAAPAAGPSPSGSRASSSSRNRVPDIGVRGGGGGTPLSTRFLRRNAGAALVLRTWGCAWIAAAVVAGGWTIAQLLGARTLPHALALLPVLLVVAGGIAIGTQLLRPSRGLALRLTLFLGVSVGLAAVLDAPAGAPWLCTPVALAAVLLLAVPPLVTALRLGRSVATAR